MPTRTIKTTLSRRVYDDYIVCVYTTYNLWIAMKYQNSK